MKRILVIIGIIIAFVIGAGLTVWQSQKLASGELQGDTRARASYACESWCGMCGYTFIPCGTHCPAQSECGGCGTSDCRGADAVAAAPDTSDPNDGVSEPTRGDNNRLSNDVGYTPPGTNTVVPTNDQASADAQTLAGPYTPGATSGTDITSCATGGLSQCCSLGSPAREECLKQNGGGMLGGDGCFKDGKMLTPEQCYQACLNSQTDPAAPARCTGTIIACTGTQNQSGPQNAQFTNEGGTCQTFTSIAAAQAFAGGCGQIDLGNFGYIYDKTSCGGTTTTQAGGPPPEQPPGPTPPPPPPGTPYCQNVRVYRVTGDASLAASWTLLTATDLAGLTAGTEVRIASVGNLNTAGGQFDKARFRINGGTWIESTTQNPNGEYYTTFILTAGTLNYTFETEVHHATLNLWY